MGDEYEKYLQELVAHSYIVEHLPPQAEGFKGLAEPEEKGVGGLGELPEQGG